MNPKFFLSVIVILLLINIYLTINVLFKGFDKGGANNLNTKKPSSTSETGFKTSPSPKEIGDVSEYNITFYGFVDNDPPGRDIAFPKYKYLSTIHDQAGGKGTFDDPITLASDPKKLKIGTKVYVPFLKKYFVMEDSCATCIKDWQLKNKAHIDLWIESEEINSDKLLECENLLTRQRADVEINPKEEREVDLTPLFNISTGECIKI